MSARPAIIFTALFILLLPVYLYFDKPADRPMTKAEQQQESLLKLDSINSIAIKRGTEGLRYEKTSDGKLFQLVEPPGKFVPQDLMQALAGLLIDAKQVEVVAENSNDLAQFGLDNPRSEMTINAPGIEKPIHLFFGAENPTHTAVYARIEGIPKVFLLGRNLSYYESVIFEWVEGKQGKNA